MTVIRFDAARRRRDRRRAGEAQGMPDLSAIELSERQVSAEITTSFVEDVRRLLTGTLLTAALGAVGTVLVTLALVVAVVASPLVAAALVYVVVRHHRAERARLGPAPA
jgi:hypothetical protein